MNSDSDVSAASNSLNELASQVGPLQALGFAPIDVYIAGQLASASPGPEDRHRRPRPRCRRPPRSPATASPLQGTDFTFPSPTTLTAIPSMSGIGGSSAGAAAGTAAGGGGGILYALVARGAVVLAEHAAAAGNSSVVAVQLLTKVPPGQEGFRASWAAERHIFHVLCTGGLTYICMADEVGWGGVGGCCLLPFLCWLCVGRQSV